MNPLIKTTDDNFHKEVLDSDIPVLVDFWAPWCGPCKMLAPTLEEISRENNGKIKIVKIRRRVLLSGALNQLPRNQR